MRFLGLRSSVLLLGLALVGCDGRVSGWGTATEIFSGRVSQECSAADPGCVAPDRAVLPAAFRTAWDPGLQTAGGIPVRTTVCATLSPSGGDDTAAINAAIDACPSGQVVDLAAGTFLISANSSVFLDRDVVLRGRGQRQTTLRRVDFDGRTFFPTIRIGRGRFPTPPVNLTSDAEKGTRVARVDSTSGLAVGDLVVLDQHADDYVIWSPDQETSIDARSWNMVHPERPLSQTMEIIGIDGLDVTFATPFHVTFKVALAAQIESQGAVLRAAGVEDLTIHNTVDQYGNGNILFDTVAYCWARNVELSNTTGPSFLFATSYRSEIRDSYVHDTTQPYPGGAGYLGSVEAGSSDNLIENNVIVRGNKLIVFRASGGGNVVGYNYMDDAYTAANLSWQDMGLTASHMTTPHLELFEGNHGVNADSDTRWGNSIWITYFRNHVTGHRRMSEPAGPAHGYTDTGFVRIIAGQYWTRSLAFVGNVLGDASVTTSANGWALGLDAADESAAKKVYAWGINPTFWSSVGCGDPCNNAPPAWGTPDPMVRATSIADGNYDYFTDQVRWNDGGLAIERQTLPTSLYLTERPAFFEGGTWPWVTPEGVSKLAVLPAEQRFEALYAQGL